MKFPRFPKDIESIIVTYCVGPLRAINNEYWTRVMEGTHEVSLLCEEFTLAISLDRQCRSRIGLRIRVLMILPYYSTAPRAWCDEASHFISEA